MGEESHFQLKCLEVNIHLLWASNILPGKKTKPGGRELYISDNCTFNIWAEGILGEMFFTIKICQWCQF